MEMVGIELKYNKSKRCIITLHLPSVVVNECSQTARSTPGSSTCTVTWNFSVFRKRLFLCQKVLSVGERICKIVPALFMAENNVASVGQQRIVPFMHRYPAQCLHLLVLAALRCWLLARKSGLCGWMEQGGSEDERWQPDAQITSASLENVVDISLCFKGCLEFQELGPGVRAGACASILAIPVLQLRSNAAPFEVKSLVWESDTRSGFRLQS
ncbi:hypothetical protein mRhiFer1_008696 [Rhinolophus ferrumequinum]|uniref:Uncharacterized protein n=1 Tax=Rhinolophus ferrumequinum TaxID=59479 RepID=A0A7J7TQE4_RHIFE|nr:hypothetical protein mRhiFer1_008696 [Rhinolophus ferrumequinum]